MQCEISNSGAHRRRQAKFVALLAAVVAIGAALVPSSAQAISIANPGPISATLTGGSVDIGTGSSKIHVELATHGSNSRVQGTIDANGRVVLQKDKVKIEPQTVATSIGITIKINFNATADGGGTFDPATGAVSWSLAGVFHIEHPLLGSTCDVGSVASPIAIANASTSAAGGQRYRADTGTFITTASGFTIPAVTSCGTFTGTINSMLNLPYPGAATLKWKLDQKITSSSGGGGNTNGGGGGAGGGSGKDGTYAALGTPSPTLDGKYVRLAIGCNGEQGTSCDGKIKLSGRYRRAAIATRLLGYSLQAGDAKTLKLKVTSLRRIKAASRKMGRMPVKISVTPNGGKREIFKRSLWL